MSTNTTVSGCISHGSDGFFHLQLQDDVSGSRIIEIKMDAQQFADVVTARYTTKIAATVFTKAADLWGRFVRENDYLTFTFTFDTFEADYIAARAGAPEGWNVETLPLDAAGKPRWNTHHAATKNGIHTYRLSMSRMVPVDVTA